MLRALVWAITAFGIICASLPLHAQLLREDDPEVQFHGLRGHVAHIDINKTEYFDDNGQDTTSSSASFSQIGQLESWNTPWIRSNIQSKSNTIVAGEALLKNMRRIEYEAISSHARARLDSMNSIIHAISTQLEYDSLGRIIKASIIDSVLVDPRKPIRMPTPIYHEKPDTVTPSPTDTILINVPKGISLEHSMKQLFFYPVGDSSHIPAVVLVELDNRPEATVRVFRDQDGLWYRAESSTSKFDCSGARIREVLIHSHPLMTNEFLPNRYGDPIRLVNIDDITYRDPRPNDTTWYQYTYDDQGNWIERIKFERPGWWQLEEDPTTPITVRDIVRRTITYYTSEQSPGYVESPRPEIFWSIGTLP